MNMLFIVLTLLAFQSHYCVLGAQPLNYTNWAQKKVMFLVAHPDDIEGLVGGTAAFLYKQGTTMIYVIATNGDKGCSNIPLCGNWTTTQIAATRQVETLNAAQVNGVPSTNVVFLGYEDCMVTSNETAILQDFIQQIRTWQPDVVMSFYPYPKLELQPSNWGDLGFHPDHQAVGGIALTAKFESGVKRQYPELGPGFHPPEYYIWELLTPSLYVDISTVLPQKITAFSQHKTQYPTFAYLEQEVTTLAANVAKNVGVSGVKFAEGFTPFN